MISRQLTTSHCFCFKAKTGGFFTTVFGVVVLVADFTIATGAFSLNSGFLCVCMSFVTFFKPKFFYRTLSLMTERPNDDRII